MSTFLLVSSIALWLAVLFLGFLLLGALRRPDLRLVAHSRHTEAAPLLAVHTYFGDLFGDSALRPRLAADNIGSGAGRSRKDARRR